MDNIYQVQNIFDKDTLIELDRNNDEYAKEYKKNLTEQQNKVKKITEEKAKRLNEICDKYYLATQSRYDKSIDILRPFGSFKEMNKLYSETNTQELKRIKDMYLDVSDAKIVGTSQYGVYFRLLKKDDIKRYEIYANDSIKFAKTRSFLFDFRQFLDYIISEYKGIPLFWYSNFNAYGYESYLGTQKLTNNIDYFVNNLCDLEQNLYEHEFVCRIPIELNSTTGFIGKINYGILVLHN